MKRLIGGILLIAALFVLIFCGDNSRETIKENRIYQALAHEKFGPLDSSKRLHIIVGLDYIPYELIEIFEQITGIKVVVDIFDTNEILEAKLLAGGAQYDIVFPTAWPSFSRQLGARIFQKLDKTRVDIKIFDKNIMKKLARYDHNNEYCLPFQFGISGIGINEKMVDNIMENAPKNSLALIFDPKIVKKLSKHRVAIYDSPDELFPAVMAYLGLDPESENPEDTKKAAEHLKKIRPYISKFTEFGFEDLASDNVCATLSSTSGDIYRVSLDNKKPYIKFFCPKEGASLWVDVVAIPSNARNVNNAYAFLKFLFHPMVIAEVTNLTSRANAVESADKYVDKTLLKNESIYPSGELRKKCYIENIAPPLIEMLRTRLLTKIKSMEE